MYLSLEPYSKGTAQLSVNLECIKYVGQTRVKDVYISIGIGDDNNFLAVSTYKGKQLDTPGRPIEFISTEICQQLTEDDIIEIELLGYYKQ